MAARTLVVSRWSFFVNDQRQTANENIVEGIMGSPVKKKSASTASRLARWRWWIQGGFLLIWLDPLLLRMHAVCSPVFHCYSCPLATFACPIGALATFSLMVPEPEPVLTVIVRVLAGPALTAVTDAPVTPVVVREKLAGAPPVTLSEKVTVN